MYINSNSYYLGYFIYYLLTTEGTLVERFKKGITPIIQPRQGTIIKI